jgi:hypothetical protein
MRTGDAKNPHMLANLYLTRLCAGYSRDARKNKEKSGKDA